MGIDKCTVLFHGKPLIYWPYKALRDITDEVILSVSKDKDASSLKTFFGDGVKIVTDEQPDLGPISGLYSSFKKAKGEYIAVIACDSPLVKTELFIKLFEISGGADGAVPFVRGFFEPFHGVYKRIAMLNALEKVIEGGKTRPKDTYEYLDIVKLHEDEILVFDPELVSFLNINSFSDLARVFGIFVGMRNKKY